MFFRSISESLLLEISWIGSDLANESRFFSWALVVFEQHSSEKGFTCCQSCENQ